MATRLNLSPCADLLGAQKPHLARVTSRLTIVFAIVCSGINSILLLLLRNVWGTFFSSEPEIIALVANVLPLVAAFQLWDGLSGAMGGVLRGAGKPTLGAIASRFPLCRYLLMLTRLLIRSTRRVTTSSVSLSASLLRSSDPSSA